MTEDFEVNDTGTVRKLNLTQMALIKALMIIDALEASHPYGEIDAAMAQAESDLEDLTMLRAELGLQSSDSESSLE